MTSTDKQSEAYLLLQTQPENYAYLIIFLIVSSFSWTTFSGLLSFRFKSETVGFVSMFSLMVTVSFFDMIMAYVKFINPTCENIDGDLCVKYKATVFSDALRVLFVLIFPHIGVKRAFFGLKFNNLDCYSDKLLLTS